ncbi:hypothetical protein HYT52_04290 [Candidatus Woesearchaeota archaeon]|nr:hypothetical protein [Candidatus Woesearchaeota archaeon]
MKTKYLPLLTTLVMMGCQQTELEKELEKLQYEAVVLGATDLNNDGYIDYPEKTDFLIKLYQSFGVEKPYSVTVASGGRSSFFVGSGRSLDVRGVDEATQIQWLREYIAKRNTERR